jgi:chromosome segregation ATPase
METKEKYIVENEVKVKSMLSEMYNNESSLLAKINKKKEHLEQLRSEIAEMEKDFQNQNNLRTELTHKFEVIKDSETPDWEEFRKEYEMVLDFAEGDKNNFIAKAESFLDDLNKRIGQLENSLKEASEEAQKKTQEMLEDLSERRNALQSRLEEAKVDTGEIWKEVRQWFIERANSIRGMF